MKRKKFKFELEQQKKKIGRSRKEPKALVADEPIVIKYKSKLKVTSKSQKKKESTKNTKSSKRNR